MPALRPVSPKLATAGEPTVVYGPPEVGERCTVYEVAPLTAFHDTVITEVDTPVVARPVGVPSPVVADAWADATEVPDVSTAATT